MKLPPVQMIASLPDQATFLIEVPAHLEAFQGHFPEHPILPGVVQIDWVVRLASLHLNMSDKTMRDFQVKYFNIIHPDSKLNLKIEIDRPNNRLTFKYSSLDKTMSSGIFKLGLKP